MSILHKCDRCGGIDQHGVGYTIDEIRGVSGGSAPDGKARSSWYRKELCPACRVKLLDWLSGSGELQTALDHAHKDLEVCVVQKGEWMELARGLEAAVEELQLRLQAVSKGE